MNSIERCRPYAYWVLFIAALGGFLQSFVTCVIAGALGFIAEEFHLTAAQEGFAASIILLGALAGASLCGYLADKIGRRRSFFLSAAIYLLTAFAAFFIGSLSSFLLLRFATGLAVGMTSILVPLYLAEIAPPAKRGAFVTAFQFAVTVGTLAAYLVNLAVADTGSWRMMFFLAAVPAAFQCVGLFFFPESPKWLLGNRQFEKAKSVLAKLQLGGVIQLEQEPLLSSTQGRSWKELFYRSYRLILIIGIALCVFQQFCGINAIIYFTPKIFALAGASSAKDAMVPTLVLGVVNLLSTFCSFFLIDRLGRRKLLLASQMGLSLCLLVITFTFASQNLIGSLALISLIGYVASYSLGAGPVTWVLIAEIYPLSIRAKAIAVMTFLSWLSNYLVVLSFPYFLMQLGSALTFGLYGAIAIGSVLFFFRMIPETKGKSLEELGNLLNSSKTD